MRDGWDWLRQVAPRGLYGRAALILVLPVVVVTLVVSVVFLQRHFERVTQQMTETMALQVTLITKVIDEAPEARTALLWVSQVAVPLELQIALPAPTAPGVRREWSDFTGRVVAEEMARLVPQLTSVDLSNSRRVVLGFSTRYGPATIGFPRSRVSASNPHQLLVLMIFTALLASVIASIFLRNQLRPIRRLAKAAEEFGRGRIVPYRPAGATEIRSAGAAFLDMRARIERQIEQRTLMLSGVSHDLRTPLTRLRLGLSMLSPDDKPTRQELREMEGDVDDMASLLDAFLEFARADAQDRPAEELAPLPFVRGLVADARRAGLAVSLGNVEGAEDALAAFSPDGLRRAVENLIGNAVRYGAEAQVDVAIGPRSLRISVEDDGPGIPAERREEALRPFTRLDAARNQDRGGGVGLGLSIAADIARAHGGQLRLGDGSRLGGLRAEIVIPR